MYICVHVYISVYIFYIFSLIFKRCAARFATKWTSRELLRRPVARYSAACVFKFCWICISLCILAYLFAYLCIFLYIRTYLQKMRRAICFKMNVSRSPGAACGSSYGRFCIFVNFRWFFMEFVSSSFDEYAKKEPPFRRKVHENWYKYKNSHSSSHRPPQDLSRRSFCSKSHGASF